MISFDVDKAWFNYRVAGIAVDGNRVLLHRAERDDFWSFPGGRGELLEPSTETLKREMREELGVEIRVERLLWVVENFFKHENKRYHELALYYLMSFPTDPRIYEKDEPFFGEESPGTEESLKLIFEWHCLSELEKIRLYPSFFRRSLRSLPSATEHVVHADSEKL